MDAPFLGFCRHLLFACGARDPRTQGVQGLFVWGGGPLRAPPQALFHTARFSRPRFFFSARPLGPRWLASSTMLDGRLQGRMPSESCSENIPEIFERDVASEDWDETS